MYRYISFKISEYLMFKDYPGRGILCGLHKDGKHLVHGYFITGRSENSKNRIFERCEDGIRILPYDEKKVDDSSLIIYNPMRILGSKIILTNGDQTDTIRDFISQGKTFEDALSTRTFEPDEPNLTPRISSILDSSSGKYTLSILKSAGNTIYSPCQRQFFNYEPVAGTGHLIHTYLDDTSPLPSFTGEPLAIDLEDDIEVLAQNMWKALPEEYKISIYVRYTELKSGKYEDVLYNINK